MGHTSIWMFPIYGMASIIKPISFELKKHHVKRTERGLLYTLRIFSAEFISGCMLKKRLSVLGIIASVNIILKE